MTTWADVINLALRDSGVVAAGQTPSAQMSNDSKMRVNMMIAQWKRRRWLVYHLIDLTTPMDGSLFYTLGVGQTIDYPRTDQIDSAYVRQTTTPVPNQVDYPLRLIDSYEEYSRITMKNLQAGPGWYLFYDSGYPVGKLYPWPLMSSQYELHIQIKAELDSVTNLTDTIILPPEYHEAIYTNLMMRTRMAYRLPSDPVINGLAKASLETLRAANFQVANLTMPGAVQPRGAYNVWSDSYGPAGR